MRPRLILVEGAKGTGKSTITNALRENIPYTQLVRLSGIEDKGFTGRDKIFNVHLNALKFVNDCSKCNTNFVFDRTHLSERVFCQIADKPYTFEDETDRLNYIIKHLEQYYDVGWYFLVAYEDEFASRLDRGKADDRLVKSSVELSLKQQQLYRKEAGKLLNKNIIFMDTSRNSITELVQEIIKGL